MILVFPRYAIDELRLAMNMDSYETVFARRGRDVLRQMDTWLDNISRDQKSGTLAEKISRDRPYELNDGCRTINGEMIMEHASVDDQGQCAKLYPVNKDPRLVAGAPTTDDVLKCNLKPLNAADYPKTMKPAQFKGLVEIFPIGVCDYKVPGVGQQITQSTWLHYTPDVAAPRLSATLGTRR